MKKQSHTDLKKVFKSIDNAMDDPKHLEKMKKLYSEKGVLQPSPALLVKLGSIAVHADEMLSDKGHHFDVGVLEALLNDSDVKDWLVAMDKLALLPRKR